MKAITSAHFEAWLKNFIARELILPNGGLPTIRILPLFVGGVYVRKSCLIISLCSGEISIPSLLSTGILVRKLPFPALGSITSPQSDQL